MGDRTPTASYAGTDRDGFLQRLVTLVDRAGLAPKPALTPEEYERQLITHGRAILAANPHLDPTAGLQLFRDLFMVNPDHMRWRLLGEMSHRRSQLDRAHRSYLRVLELEPDLLGPMDHLRFETLHTRLFASLMNRERFPLFADDLLLAFLGLVAGMYEDLDETVTYATVKRARVVPERTVPPHGRVDLSIRLPRLLAFVEMKVDAQEGGQQLPRYRKALRSLTHDTRRDALLIYLTPENTKKPSVPPDAWLTYRDVLRAWLPTAAAGSTDEHRYLQRYLVSLARDLCQPAVAGHGDFEDWTIAERRNALEFLGEIP